MKINLQMKLDNLLFEEYFSNGDFSNVINLPCDLHIGYYFSYSTNLNGHVHVSPHEYMSIKDMTFSETRNGGYETDLYLGINEIVRDFDCNDNFEVDIEIFLDFYCKDERGNYVLIDLCTSDDFNDIINLPESHSSCSIEFSEEYILKCCYWDSDQERKSDIRSDLVKSVRNWDLYYSDGLVHLKGHSLSNGRGRLLIRDQAGSTVYELTVRTSVGENILIENINWLRSGIYFITFYSEDIKRTKKFFVNN